MPARRASGRAACCQSAQPMTAPHFQVISTVHANGFNTASLLCQRIDSRAIARRLCSRLTCDSHQSETNATSDPASSSLKCEGVPIPSADPDIKTRECAADHLCIRLHGATLAAAHSKHSTQSAYICKVSQNRGSGDHS